MRKRLIAAILALSLLFGGCSSFDVYAGGQHLNATEPAAADNDSPAHTGVVLGILAVCIAVGGIFVANNR